MGRHPSGLQFKPTLNVGNGHWWAVVDKTEGWRIWAPIGLTSCLPVKDALVCYRLAYYYFQAGILGVLVKEGIRENGVTVEKFIFPKESDGTNSH